MVEMDGLLEHYHEMMELCRAFVERRKTEEAAGCRHTVVVEGVNFSFISPILSSPLVNANGVRRR